MAVEVRCRHNGQTAARMGSGVSKTVRTAVAGLAAALALGACTTSRAQPEPARPTATARVAPVALNWETGRAAGLGPRVDWLTITGADGNPASRQTGHIVRPPGSGTYPILIYLHGSGGLTRGDLMVARQLADAGFLTLVVCWRQSAGCHQTVASDEGSVDAIVRVAQAQPGARVDRVGVLGISLGGWEVFNLLARRHDLSAGVADSAESGVDPAEIDAPILILAPEADRGVSNSRETERALRGAGKSVEAHYFAGAGHVVTHDPHAGEEAITMSVDFLHRHLE